MKTNKKKSKLPKLPRFVVPKDMSSKIYVDKKRKSNTRNQLKKLVNLDHLF